MVSGDVDAVIFTYKQGRFAEAADLLRDVECKIVQQSKNAENFLNEILRGELIKNELTSPQTCADADKFWMDFVNLVIKIIHLFPQVCKKFGAHCMQVSISGYFCSKSARLKEIWLRLFRKSVKHTLEFNKSSPDIQYGSQLFEQLSVRQPQTIHASILLALGKLICCHKETQERFHDRLLSYLKNILLTKLTESSKRSEFTMLNAIFRTVAMVLPTVENIQNSDDTKTFYECAVRILNADLDEIKQYGIIRSVCRFFESCSPYLNEYVLDNCYSCISRLRNLALHNNIHLAVSAKGALFALLRRCCDFLESMTSSVTGFQSSSSFEPSHLCYCLNSLFSKYLSRVDQSLKSTALSLRGLSYISKIHRLTLPSAEALNIFEQMLSKVELILSSDNLSHETEEQTVETDANPKSQVHLSNTMRLTHLLPDLIITVVNIIPEIDFLLTSASSVSESRPRPQESDRAFLLLEHLMISGFESYPKCAILLARKLGCAIFFAIQHFSEAHKSTFEHFRSLLNDVVYHYILRTCSHSTFDVNALESSDTENEFEAAEPEQLASTDADIPVSALDMKIQEDEGPSAPQQSSVSFRDYIPLWITLLGISSELNLQKKRCQSSSDAPDRPATPSVLVGDALLPSVLRILSKLDLSYQVGREVEASEPAPSDLVAVNNPQDLLIFSNLVAFLEYIVPSCPLEYFGLQIGPFIQTCVELTQRYKLLSGLYRLLALMISIACKCDFFDKIHIRNPEAKSSAQVLGAFALQLLDRLQESLGTGRHSMAIASDDLFVSSLICLLRLPVNFFCCQVALIPEAAADLNLPAYRKLAEKLATAVGAAVQLAVLTEHCADLALVALEAVESWLDGVSTEKEVYRLLYQYLVPELLLLLQSVSTVQISQTQGLKDSNRAKFGATKLLQTSRSGARLRPKAALQRAIRTIGRLRPVTSASIDGPKMSLQKAQARLLQLIGRTIASFRVLVPLPKPSKQITGPEPLHAFSTSDLFRRHFSICLPFPDLRPQLFLADSQLLSRCFFLLFWRPSNSLHCQSDSRGAVSRQARVSAAEFLHEFIVLGVTNRVNSRSSAQLSSLPFSASPADSTSDNLRFWGLMFHSTLILAVDTDPLVSGLFRRLALQLVHWFAGYPAAGIPEARCLQLVLLSITGLVDGTLLNTEDAYYVGGEVFQRQWPLPEQVFLNRIRLAATCLHEFIHWSSKRPPEAGIFPVFLADGKCVEEGLMSSTPNATAAHTEFVEFLAEHVIQANKSVDFFKRMGSSLVFSQVLFPVLRNEARILRRYIFEFLDSFVTSASLSEEDESTTEPQRHVCVALKQVERLLVGLREQGADCLSLTSFSSSWGDGQTPEKRPRMTRVAASAAAVVETSPLEFCRKPPSWQSTSFFDLLDVLLRACLRVSSTPNLLIRLTAFSSCGTTPLPSRVRGVLRSLTENLLASFGQDLEAASNTAGVYRPASRLLEAFLRQHGGPEYLYSMFNLEDFDSRLTVLAAVLDGLSWLLNAGLLPGNAVQCILQGSGSQILDTLNTICETAPTSPVLNNLVQASSCSIFWNTVVSFLAASFRQSATDAASLFASNCPVWRCLALMIMQPRKLYLNHLEWLTDACGTSQLRQLLHSLPLDIIEHIVKLSRQFLETVGLARPDYDLSWLDFTSYEEEKKALKRATKLAHMLNGVTFLIGVVNASAKTVLTSALPDGLCQSLGNKIYLLSSDRRNSSLPFPLVELAQTVLLLSWSLNGKDEFSEETVRWIFRVAPFIAGGADSRQPLPPHLLLFIGLSADTDTPPGPSLFSKSPRSALELVTELIERLGTSTNKQDTPKSSSFLSKLCEELSKVWPLKIQPLVADSSCDSSIKNAAVELLERVILFAPQELGRSNFFDTFLLLLSDQSLNHSQQVKILGMLAFFLHALPPSTGLSLPSDERSRLCEAVKLFLAANLPLDVDEFSQSAVRSSEFTAIIRSVLSCLEMTACPEVMSALAMTFCRHASHPLDEELTTALRKALQNKHAIPALQADLLSGALNDFLGGLSSLQQNVQVPPDHLILTLSVWRRFLTKFLQPLLLYADVTALESFASSHISDLMRVLESPITAASSLVTWWGMLLHRSAVFDLFSVFYNRLPKDCLHGTQAALLRVLFRDTPVKGTELTASLIKKAHSCMQDRLTCTPGMIFGQTIESFNEELQRNLWTAALSCLTATVCATQTNEKFYNFVFLPDLLNRLLPKDSDKILSFLRLRSEKQRSIFLQLPSSSSLPTDAGSSVASMEQVPATSPLASSSSGLHFRMPHGLVKGSSMALEMHRFSRTPGTQIFRPRESTGTGTSLSPVSPSALMPPPSPAAAPQSRTLEPCPPSAVVRVQLEDDCINSMPLMACLIGLLKKMRLGGIMATPPTSAKQNVLLTDVPVCIRYFYDHFTSPNAQVNVRSFIAKLIVNCPEVFRPFGQFWLAPLLTYLASEAAPLIDSSSSGANHSLSSLGIDLCLLLADWASQSEAALAPVLPTSSMEQETAAAVLAILIRRAWLQGDSSSALGTSTTYGDASYEQHLNVDLFRLLLDCWTTVEITQPLIRELLTHLYSAKNYKQTAFYLDHLREILLSRAALSTDSFGAALPDLVNAIRKNITQNQKALLTSAWEVGGLLIARCTVSAANDQKPPVPSLEGEFLRSRGEDLLPLSLIPLELQNLALEMWMQVSEMATPSRASSASRSTPATGALLEAACSAASHWLPLSLHLASTVLAFYQPVSIEASLPRFLTLLTSLFQALASDTGGFSSTVGAPLKLEVLSTLLKSSFLQQTSSGTSEILTAGLLLMLRLVQFIFTFVTTAQSEFSPASAEDYLCQLLRTSLVTLLRFNSTPVSRRLVYRILAEVQQRSNQRFSNRTIKCLVDLGFAFGMSAESDRALRRIVRSHLSRRHLTNSDGETAAAVTSSLSRYLATLGLLSSTSTCCSPEESTTRDALGPEIRSLISALLPNFLTCSLQLFLEPAVKSAEFRHPLYNWPLDPACQFYKASRVPFSQSLVSGLMDPAMRSGTQTLLSQSQALADSTATLSITSGTDAPMSDTTETLLATAALPMMTTATLAVPSTSLMDTQVPSGEERTLALSAIGESSMLVDLQNHPLKMSHWPSPMALVKKRGKLEKSLTPVARLRRRFKFHTASPALVQQTSSTSAGSPTAKDRTRDFFKQRAIAKQRAEYATATAIATGSLFASDRLAGSGDGDGTVERVRTHCSRRYRVGNLPDVQSLTPEAFLQPLFALLTADACGFAPRLNTLVLVGGLESLLGSEQAAFVVRLAAQLSRLLQVAARMADQQEAAARALVATAFALVWELHQRAVEVKETAPDILTVLPMPQDIAEAALATGQTEAAICLLEEILCAAALNRNPSPQLSECSAWLSSWTTGSLKSYNWILSPYSMPDELVPLACADQYNEGNLTTVSVWWHLARLYRFAGRGSELIGWLADRWASIHPISSDSPSALRCVGNALLAMRRLDYEKAFSEFSELVAAYDVDEECEEETGENEAPNPSGIWASCPDSISVELQLICREELLRCLEEMGSWQELDELATSTAGSLLESSSPSPEGATTTSSSALVASACTTSKDSLASLWSNAYAADSVMPLVLRARLQLAVQAEIEARCGTVSVSQEQLQHLEDILQPRLNAVDMGPYFESKYPYELAILSVLENNWPKARSFCEAAFKQLSQTWTTCSFGEYRNNLERSQLLTELEDFLESMSLQPLTETDASGLLSKWRMQLVEDSLEHITVSEEVLTNRLLFLSKVSSVARTVSQLDSLLPACFDFRLTSAKACIRANSIRRALDRLSPLQRLAKTLDDSTDYLIIPQCCRLAWRNTLAGCWSAAFDLDGLANRCVVELSADARQGQIEKGLTQGLSALSQCIDLYPQLREAISSHPILSIVQFSHSIEFGRLLVRLAQLLSTNRLSADGSATVDPLLSTLEARAKRVDGLFELHLYPGAAERIDRLNSLAFVFLRRAACLAHGVYEEIHIIKTNPNSITSRIGEGRLDEESRMSRVLFSTPAEALIEFADFSDAQMSVIEPKTDRLEGLSSTPPVQLALAHAFIYSVLTAMYLGADAGRLRFARALQVTGRLGTYVDVEPDLRDACISQHSIDSRRLTQTFRSLVQRIPTWMFLQWLDNLMSALFQDSPLFVLLVEPPLLQLCKAYPQTVFYFFRVAVTAALHAAEKSSGPGLRGTSAVERLVAHLATSQFSNPSSGIVISKLAQQLSKLRMLDRFLSELEKFSEPDLIFRDWAMSEAKNVLRTSQSSSATRERLIQSLNRLIENHFTHLPPDSFMQTDTNAENVCTSESTLREQKVKKLSECLRVEFGPSGAKLHTLTPAELNDCLRRVDAVFTSSFTSDHSSSADPSSRQQSRPSLNDFCLWLASFDETQDLNLELPGHFLKHLGRPSRENVVYIHRVHPSVKPLVSLRRPKVIRILGSDGVWSNWMVKSGEDLRQDSRIQHLFHFANHALARAPTGKHQPIPSKSDDAVDNQTSTLLLRTYLILPVTSQLGLLRWIPDTKTVAGFCKSAMRASEVTMYNSEATVFAAETGKLGGSPDALWTCSGSALVSRFLSLERLVFSMRLLRRGLCQLASSPEHYSMLRWRLISSHAAISAAHYILGIGDRHLENFLIDLSSGDLIGIDFGYAFGVTIVILPTPEYVPLRLTASLRELLEPSGPAGHFGVALSQALSALRGSSNLFFSVLKTFVADDSTVDWSAYALQVGQTGEVFQASRLTLAHNKLLGRCPVQLLSEDCALRFAGRPWFADCANTLRRTVDVTTTEAVGGSRSTSEELLTPAEQARRLVCLSTSPELLARMHPGWNASL